MSSSKRTPAKCGGSLRYGPSCGADENLKAMSLRGSGGLLAKPGLDLGETVLYAMCMAVSQFSLNKFRHIADPDDALDMAYDYERGGFEDFEDHAEDNGMDWLD